MFPIVEPRQRPERFLLNRFSPLAENAVFLGLGGFDAAGSVWYPDATRLLGAVPNDGTLINMEPATDWVWVPELGRWATNHDGIDERVMLGVGTRLQYNQPWTVSFWCKHNSDGVIGIAVWLTDGNALSGVGFGKTNTGLMLTVQHGSWLTLKTSDAFTWADRPHHIAVSNVNGTAYTLYWDGKPKATVSGGYTGWPGGTTPAVGMAGIYTGAGQWAGLVADCLFHSTCLPAATISALADPSNVMLEVGGVPLILPPHRVSFPAAVAEPSGFKPYWLRRSTQIIGGGIAA